MGDKKAQSFITVTIAIAVLALLLRIALEQVIKINILQNESNAVATLKLISTALDNYAKDHVGVFPASTSLLTQTTPPYITKDYLKQSPVKGYSYSFLRLEPYSYSVKAVPSKCNLTGKKNFTISTGGLLISEECLKQE